MTIGDEPDPNRPQSDPADERGPDADEQQDTTERAAPRVPTRITADEQIVDDLVGGLFRDVDSRFTNLEQRVQKAREDLSETDMQRVRHRDMAAASAAREAVATEVATLRADVERQASELVGRRRQIDDLRSRLEQAETRAEAAERRAEASEEAIEAAQSVRQELHEERRELARLRALLDARSVEREELANATQRLQHEKEQVDEQLASALDSVEEVDRLRSQLVEDVAQLEAARDAEASEHQLRQQDLADARAEIRRLSEQVDELTTARDEALRRAEKADSAVERRGNEVNYLNRRIDSLTDRAAESDQLESEVKGLLEQQTVLARQIADLQRELDTKTSEAAASAKAVESIAERASQHDDLVAAVASLQADLAEARATASSAEQAAIDAQTATAAEAEARATAELRAAEAEAEAQATQAALALQTAATEAAESAFAAQAAQVASDTATTAAQAPADVQYAEPVGGSAPEDAVAESIGDPVAEGEPPIEDRLSTGYVAPQLQVPEMPSAGDESPDEVPGTSELVWAEDLAVPPELSDAPVMAEEAPAPIEVPPPAAEMIEVPEIEVPDPPAESEHALTEPIEVPELVAEMLDVPEPLEPAPPVPEAEHIEVPELVAEMLEVPQDPIVDIEPVDAEPEEIELVDAEPDEIEPVDAEPDEIEPVDAEPDDDEEVAVEADPLVDEATASVPDAPTIPVPDAGSPSAPSPFTTATTDEPAGRRRLVLPAEMQPDTPEAVEYLLAQPGVTAIVDARSFCGRTGIRPSELFDRIAALRDRFDVPIEVVVTPVSTPVGGTPDLPAIGVHHVTGADTVSDRVRALCSGFPPDQQLVVVAGDDHVRRAAIGEEANVVDPAIVLDVT